MCYPADFGRSRSNDTSVIKEIRLKISPLAFTLSRSLKVIGTDTLIRRRALLYRPLHISLNSANHAEHFTGRFSLSDIRQKVNYSTTVNYVYMFFHYQW